MSTHTPGPWVSVAHDESGLHQVRMGEAIGSSAYASHLVWECEHSVYPEEDGNQWAEADANARLIAAAPELLDALKLLRIDANRLCDRQLGGSYEDDCRRAIAIADAAIAKAEGR